MDDDDDMLCDFDVDALIQQQAKRDAEQASSQSNQRQHQYTETPTPAAPPSGPPRPGGGLLPHYSNPLQPNPRPPARPPTAPPYGTNAGQLAPSSQAPRPPTIAPPPLHQGFPQQLRQQPQPQAGWPGAVLPVNGPSGGVPFQDVPGNLPAGIQHQQQQHQQQARAPYGAASGSACGGGSGAYSAKSCAAGNAAGAVGGGPGPAPAPPPHPAGNHPLHQQLQQPPQPQLGASKPRSLGQQLGFGGSGAGGGNATGASPYNGYGPSYGVAPPGGTAATQGHVTGALGPSAVHPGVQESMPLGKNGNSAASGQWQLSPRSATPGPVTATATATGALAMAAGVPMAATPAPAASAVSSGTAVNAVGPGAGTGGGAAAAPSAVQQPYGAAAPASAEPPALAGPPHWGPGGFGPQSSTTASGGYGPQLRMGGVGGAPHGPSAVGVVVGGGATMLPPDVNALRADSNALEAQVEALKRQLEDKMKMLKGVQSIQDELQHAKLEAQELQRKNREATARLQDERARAEAAESQRKEAQDKCLELQAELHKSRASAATASSAAARTPPGKHPPASGLKRRIGAPSDHPLAAFRPSQQAQHPLHHFSHHAGGQQHQQPDDVAMSDAVGPAYVLYDRPPPAAGAATTGGEHGQRLPPAPARGGGIGAAVGAAGPSAGPSSTAGAPHAHGGGRSGPAATGSTTTGAGMSDGTAAAAAQAATFAPRPPAAVALGPTLPPAALLRAAVDGLASSRLTLWQRLWCTCACGLTALLQPMPSAPPTLGGSGDDGGDDVAAAAACSGPGSLVSAAATVAAAAGLMPLGAFEHSHAAGGAQLRPYGISAAVAAVASVAATTAATSIGADSGTTPAGLLGGCAAYLEAIRSQLQSLAAGRDDGSGLVQGVLSFLQATAWGLGRPHELGVATSGDEGGRELAAGPAAGQQEREREREVLRPLVAVCVDLLSGLLRHSAECRAAVGASSACISQALASQAGGACHGGGGSEVPPAASTSAVALRGLRHRQLRSFVYGSAGGDGIGGVWAATRAGRAPNAFDPGGGDGGDATAAGSGSGGRPLAGRVASVGQLVRLLLRLGELYDCDEEPDAVQTEAEARAPVVDVLVGAAEALTAVAGVLPPRTRRQALLPLLRDPESLLVPLLNRSAAPARIAAVVLLHTLLECPTVVTAVAGALGVPGYSRPPDTEAMEVDEGGGAGTASYDSAIVVEPRAAVLLMTALLEALEYEDVEEGDGGGGSRRLLWGPYELPRRTLTLLAMLLDGGHEGLVAALCCPPWLDGFGLPQRLLDLADRAASAPGGAAPLEPVYPAPASPSLQVVRGASVDPAQWMERLRLAQEALLLLKELLTAPSEEIRRAVLQDLTSTSPDSDSQQLVELATSRLGAWPRLPPELLGAAAPAAAAATGAAAAELAPWAARLALGGGGAAAASRAYDAGGVGLMGLGSGGGSSGVASNVGAVGALAHSVRRRWQHWLHQQQLWQQGHMLQAAGR